MTARALSAAAGWHEAKTSRIESAKQAPSDADIRAWCQVCGADDQAVDLIAASRAADSTRLHARVVLSEWGLSIIAEVAELVVSELATNAVTVSARYGDEPGIPVVYLRLGTDHLRLLIEVWDSDPGTPVAKQAGPDDESGRGLMLVEALCDRWNWTTVPG